MNNQMRKIMRNILLIGI